MDVGQLKEALTHKYGPLPGYAWAGIGAAAIVVIASRRKTSSSSSGPAFLTTPPQSAISGDGGGGLGAGGGSFDVGDPNLGGSTGTTTPPVDPATPATPDSSTPAPAQPAALVTAEPLPALAPYADQLVARGIDPSTGGLLPGAGNSSGVPGSAVAYGPGLYDSTPTVATPAGPIPGGVFRASDPTDFGVPGPQNSVAVIAPVLATPVPPSGPPHESLIAMHNRLGRDTIEA